MVTLKADPRTCTRCAGAGSKPNWVPEDGRCYLCRGTGFLPTIAQVVREKIKGFRDHLTEMEQHAADLKIVIEKTRSRFCRDKWTKELEDLRTTYRVVRGRLGRLETGTVERVTISTLQGTKIYLSSGETL